MMQIVEYTLPLEMQIRSEVQLSTEQVEMLMGLFLQHLANNGVKIVLQKKG